MEILSAIVQLLGGLALFLYGIELMGDGLKNSSGAALKRVLEKVTGNVVMGVLTGALVTAVIQSSTATIVLTVALIGAGVLNLRQAVSIVMGANIGTTVTAQIIRLGSIQSDGSWLLWLFDTDTLAPIALIIGIVLLMFIKSKRSNTIGDICIGFGILFVGLNLMTSGVEPLVGTDAFIAFVRFLNNPLFGILFGLVLTVIVQSSSATVGMLQTVASVPGAGITFAMAYPVIMGINLGTCVTTAMVCSIGSSKDAKRTGVVHIAFNTIGTILFLLLMTVLRKLSVFSAEFWVRSVDSGNIANFQTIFNLVTAVVLFDTDTLAPIALIIGIVLLMFIKSKRSNTIGDICIGFGILFVGLNLMTSGVEPLVGTDAFIAFVRFLNNPLFGILFGLVLTVIVQSSSATVGMLQTVASVPGAGITFAMAYPVIMGINLGTCVTTAMVCSIGSSKDAKRTGVVHIAFNTIGTILFLLLMTVLRKLSVFSAEFWVRSVDSGNIANFQTIFNLVTAVVLVPFADQLVKLSMVIVKDDKQKQLRHPELHTLDEKLYNSPALAVSVAIKAVSDVGTLAKENFEKGCRMLEKYDPAVASEIDVDEDCIDEFTDRADRFFIGLSKAVETEWDDRQLDMLMQTVPNFERIGDYATNLVELSQRLVADNATFSDMAQRELKLIFDAVNEILTITVDAFAKGDNEAAKRIEPLEETIDDMVMILRDRHTKRLKSGACSVGSGLVFMETLTYLERASDQCSSIAVMMLARNNENILQNHYDYLREIHAGNDAAYSAEKERRREQYIKPLKETN